MSAATRAAPAAPPGIPSELTTYLVALVEYATDRLGDHIAATLKAEGRRLPVELRLWTAEELALEWDVAPGWWNKRVKNRMGPATKAGGGNRNRWSAADIAEYIRQGQIGPRGKDLLRVS